MLTTQLTSVQGASVPLGESSSAKDGFDHQRLEAAVREMLAAMGEDPTRDGLLDTPARVARAYAELCGGLHESPAEHLARVFEAPQSEMVLLTGFEFSSLCEHHLLPFRGKAHVAYLPSGDRVVGLSKLARTVEVYARRPQVQERLTAQVADALQAYLQPLGVFVLLEAEHMCMQLRGVSKCHGQTVTKATRGVFEHDADARAEILNLLQR